MKLKSIRPRHLIPLLSLALFAGCFSTENQPGTQVTQVVVKKTPGDSTKNQGWDDFPNKAMPDLKLLTSKVKQLPVPTGINYVTTTTIQGTKIAVAESSCAGFADYISLDVKERNLTIVDTLKYYDNQGTAMCGWGTSLLRVTHNRYLLDNYSESWEQLEDTIQQISTIPSEHIGCKGKIHLFNGVNFTIDSYGITLKTPLGHPDAMIYEGHLGFTWKDPGQVDTIGYRVDLQITKTLPFKDADFFPARGVLPRGEVVMSGPIKHDTTLVGYFDLYSDHTVMIRDWEGTAVSP